MFEIGRNSAKMYDSVRNRKEASEIGQKRLKREASDIGQFRSKWTIASEVGR